MGDALSFMLIRGYANGLVPEWNDRKGTGRLDPLDDFLRYYDMEKQNRILVDGLILFGYS